jgi:hypothetical protein
MAAELADHGVDVGRERAVHSDQIAVRVAEHAPLGREREEQRGAAAERLVIAPPRPGQPREQLR